jgi:hypothetical protein
MLHRVTVVRTDVSEEPITSIVRVTRIGEVGTMLAVFLRSVRWLLVTPNVVPSSPILVTLLVVALGSSETSVLTRATRRNIPDGLLLLELGVYIYKCVFVYRAICYPFSSVLIKSLPLAVPTMQHNYGSAAFNTHIYCSFLSTCRQMLVL